MNEKNEVFEIDLLHMALTLLKRWWAIVLAALICAVMFFGYAKFSLVPQYQSSILMYVNNTTLSVGKYSLTSTEISAAKNLVSTYCIILKSRLTLEEVIRRANLDCSYGQLRGMISASSVNDTEIFTVSVTCDDPEKSCLIANTIAVVLQEKITSVVDGSSVRTVDLAITGSPAGPNYTKWLVTGFAIGAVVCAAAILIFDAVNDKIRSEEWLIKTYGDDIPLLSVIPDADTAHSGRYNSYRKYGSSYYSSKN